MAEGVTIEFNNKEFADTLKEYIRLSSATLKDSINKKAKDVCFKAANETIKTAQVREEVQGRYPKGNFLWHAIATGKTRFGVTKYGAAVKGQGNKKLADKIYNKRIRAIGYTRAIWRKIAADFGAKLNGRTGKIQHAFGTKATKGFSPTATLNVKGVEQSHVDRIMQPAVNRALDYVAKDMQAYIARKLAQQRLRRR